MDNSRTPRQPGRFSLPNLIAVPVLLFLFYFLPYLLHQMGLLKSDLQTLFTVIGVILAIFLFFISDIIGFTHVMVVKVSMLLSKHQILISYVMDDYRWAKWIYYQLKRAGYDVVMRPWYDRHSGNDSIKEMKEASEETRYILCVGSPEYFAPIYANSKGYHSFKQGLKRRRKIFLKVRRFELKAELAGLCKADLTEAKGREDTAQDLLKSCLPGKLRKKWDTTGADSIAEDDKAFFPGSPPQLWNIPPSHSFFTGREKYIQELHIAFQISATPSPQALFGLGGIGTSAIAIEYANHYYGEYKAGFYIRMSPEEDRKHDMQRIGHLLDLPEKQGDLQKLQRQFDDWLTSHKDWLLLLDQCHDPALLKAVMPRSVNGSILLTTQADSLGNGITMVHVVKLEKDEGALFLLRRAYLLHPDESLESQRIDPLDRKVALAISEHVDGLPPVLDSIGELVRRMSLSEFFGLYQTFKKDFMTPEICTWKVAYEKVKSERPQEADLLSFCALLGRGPIPTALIEKSSALLPALNSLISDKGNLWRAMIDLMKYSLIHVDAKGMIVIHPIVQEVLKDEMDAITKCTLEKQVVQAVSRAFPPLINQDDIQDVVFYIPHADACRQMVREHGISTPEVAEMFENAAKCQQTRGEIASAEEFSRCALEMRGVVI